MARCLAASWQRRCQRWLATSRIDVEALYGPLILWASQHWQKPVHTFYLALDTTMFWNRFCVVVSVVAHGRVILLLWQTLEHPSASVSASVSIAFLENADQLLSGFESITLLADRRSVATGLAVVSVSQAENLIFSRLCRDVQLGQGARRCKHPNGAQVVALFRTLALKALN